MTSNPTSTFNEDSWVIGIRRRFDQELEDDNGMPVCIFSVPKTLMSSKPDSYIPQQVALSPFHHWRPELVEMDDYKLVASKRTQERFQTHNFQQLVDQFIKLEPRIRACYHKYLDISGETLAWMLAIDASFLLEFLHVYASKDGRLLTRVSSRMSHLLDYNGRKLVHTAILQDIMMLENQIPLFILRKILEFQYSSLEMSDDVLHSMLVGLCKELCPFKMMDFPSIQVKERAHVLDFLYHMIVPKSEEAEIIDVADDPCEPLNKEGEIFVDSSYLKALKQIFTLVWKLVSKLNRGLVCKIKNALVSGPVKQVVNLPLKIITRLPGFSTLKQPLEYLLSQNKEGIKPEDTDSGSNNDITKSPLIEEITIPSVTQLCKVGVQFLPAKGDLTSISFDMKTVTLYLPTISLDDNTEVILRNLVAYEASTASVALAITRYTELMNGIIDSEEDAKLLRERGIILNRLKSDKEVANLWNGMSKSVILTKVPFLDKVIEDVNKYYGGTWRVKVAKLVKVYVFGSWQFLTFLAAILLLLMTTLQAFCSVYSCSRVLHGKTIP